MYEKEVGHELQLTPPNIALEIGIDNMKSFITFTISMRYVFAP